MTLDVLQSDSGPAAPLHRFAHEAMACTFEVALLCDDARYAEQAAHAAFVEIDRLERELSRFVATSDVARINALKPGDFVQIGLDALDCLRLAEQLCRETSGAFDVTYASKPVGPISDVGPVSNRSSDSVESNQEPILQIDPVHRRVRVRAAGLHVDLGGIGKGYAVDRALDVLRTWGIAAGLIHSGQSSLFAFGLPDENHRWSIALRDPVDPSKIYGRVVLTNVALSGSARLLHGDHIFDPRTQTTAAAKIAAWAVAPNAALADALSTAFMIMSSEEISDYCRSHESVAAMVAETEGRKLRCQSWGNTNWLPVDG